MKIRNSARNLLVTALLAGGIFMTGALPSVNAQSDGGHIGSGVGRDSGGYLGSGNRDGGMLGSGTLTEDEGGGTIGSGTRSNQMGSGAGFTEDGGLLGSGGGAASSLALVWEFFF